MLFKWKVLTVQTALITCVLVSFQHSSQLVDVSRVLPSLKERKQGLLQMEHYDICSTNGYNVDDGGVDVIDVGRTKFFRMKLCRVLDLWPGIFSYLHHGAESFTSACFVRSRVGSCTDISNDTFFLPSQ